MTMTRVLLRLGFLLQLQHIAAQFSSCSLCRASETLLSGDVVLPANTAGLLSEDMTCSEVEVMANAGVYSPAACSLMAIIVGSRCGCEVVVDPTESPVGSATSVPTPSPTEASVAGTTDAPAVAVVTTESPVAMVQATEAPVVAIATTESPVVATEAPVISVPDTEAPVEAVPATDAPAVAVPDTEAPVVYIPETVAPATSSEAPTTTVTKAPEAQSVPSSAPVSSAPIAVPLVDLDANLFIRLVGLNRADLPNTKAFESACTTFLSEKIQGVSDLVCSVVESRSVARSLRALQTSSNLEVAINVQGKSASLSQDEFFNSVFQALNDDALLFLATLKGSNDEFESVESMEVASSSFAPIPPNKTEDTKKLGVGIIAAIVAGVVAAVVLIGVGVLLVCKRRNSKQPYPEVQESATNKSNAMASPPAVTSGQQSAKAPVAPVAAANNPASEGNGSESQENRSSENKSIASSTIAGESEMETFSVAAGNVEETVAKSGAAGDTSASGDELSSHAMSSLRQTMISRTIVAPPGKLGIVIDTTLEGPIVFKINPQSPLEGSLFPGDIIVAIDDVDTRAMSASAITALMVRTANLRRTLTVLSEDVNN